jgi:hypothetical protein
MAAAFFIDCAWISRVTISSCMTAHKKNPPAGGIRQQPTVRRRKIWTGPVALLLVVAALWWQWAQTRKQLPAGNGAPGLHSPASAAISGLWYGDVAYSGRPTHTRRFLFQAEGDKLFGTASFLAVKRGIEDGRIEGDRIFFTVRFNEALEEMSTERTHRYTGVLASGEIHFTMHDDKGSLPIEFIVKRAAR